MISQVGICVARAQLALAVVTSPIRDGDMKLCAHDERMHPDTVRHNSTRRAVTSFTQYQCFFHERKTRKQLRSVSNSRSESHILILMAHGRQQRLRATRGIISKCIT